MNFYLTFNSDISDKHKDSVVRQVKELVKIPMKFEGITQDKWTFKLLV